jgi:hypothetical protein
VTGEELGARREEQIARNEALFREVNERVQEVSEDRATATTDFLCELWRRRLQRDRAAA